MVKSPAKDRFSQRRWYQSSRVLLTLGVLITAALVIWLVGSTYLIYTRMLQANATAAAVQEIKFKIRYLDEALTMSARMAAQTGKAEWEERYRFFESAMTTALSRVGQALEANRDTELPAQLMAASARLVALEHRALRMVREGHAEQARAIFDSPDYQQQKSDYLASMERFTETLGMVALERIEILGGEVRKQSYAGGILLALLALGWFGIYRTLQHQEQHLQHQSRALMHEIHERKQAESRAWRASHLREVILDSANYSVISTDAEGVIQTFNACAQRWLGYSAEEMIGRHTPAIIHDSREVEQRAREIGRELGIILEPGFEVFVAHARRGRVDEREWQYVRKDGSRFTVLLSVTALLDEQGEISGFLGVASDITERKRIQQLKDEFISTVSHELRTPLTAIRGALGLLRGGVMGSLPPRMEEMLILSESNCQRLGLLIDDLLDIEKVEAGRMQLAMEPVAIMPVVERAIRDLQGYARQHEVCFELGERLDGARVRCDEGRLVQVLGNLLSNGAKYSPRGECVMVDVTRRDDQVRVTVTDVGSGIPDGFRHHVFDKFSQADGSTTRRKGGTGLGLAITKALLEQMGGRIDFESIPHVRTSFFFELPLLPEGD